MTPPSTAQNNKRRFLRVPKEVDVTVSILEYPLMNATSESATTKNMSEKGICFTTSVPYQPETLLNLKIKLHGWQRHLQSVASIVDDTLLTKPLTAITEVVWSKELPEKQGYEVGVRFKDIYEDDYQAFVTLLKKLNAKLVL